MPGCRSTPVPRAWATRGMTAIRASPPATKASGVRIPLQRLTHAEPTGCGQPRSLWRAQQSSANRLNTSTLLTHAPEAPEKLASLRVKMASSPMAPACAAQTTISRSSIVPQAVAQTASFPIATAMSRTRAWARSARYVTTSATVATSGQASTNVVQMEPLVEAVALLLRAMHSCHRCIPKQGLAVTQWAACANLPA